MPESSDLNKDYVKELERELHDFEQKSEGSNRTMQMLVYPAMFAFVILAAYGFYLIQSLSSDVHKMARTIDTMTESVERNMDSISGTMKEMSSHVNKLVITTKSMSGDIGSMSQNTDAMVNSISSLKSATYDMAASTNNMQRDMWSLNQNISTPLSFMNNVLPWKNNTSGPFPGSVAPLPQSYYAYPAQRNMNGQVFPLQMPVAPQNTVPAPAAMVNNPQSSLEKVPSKGGQKYTFTWRTFR